MADYERKILEFYQLEKPYPTTWPADKNEENSSDEGKEKKKRMARRKSRYQALEKAASRKSFILGSEQSDKSGNVNLVQRDEPDPLGTTDSVVRLLRAQGLPIKEDQRLRNKFLLSSTTFQPSTFLSQVHTNATADGLQVGLEKLSLSIDQKSASLKVLVETNFERFVKAKATIDNVYREMKYRGTEPPPPPPQAGLSLARPRAHSRHASRNSFRNSISGTLATVQTQPQLDNRRKNALIKESEYGVTGIKAPLLEVAAKAEDVWGPALGGREKEEHLKTVATQLEKFKDHVELSASIADSIRRQDHETLVEDYTKARRFFDATRKLAADIGKLAPTDPQLYQILLAGRIWSDVDEQIQSFKRGIWRRLISTHSTATATTKAGGITRHAQDQHIELIGLLLELGVDESPIWIWLLSRYDSLKSRIHSTTDRPKVEIEVLRRRLANGAKPSSQSVALHLESVGRQSLDSKRASIDGADVIELWGKSLALVNNLLSSSQGILGEVVDFWNTVQGFIDGKTQRALPSGHNGESRVHHVLTSQNISDLSKGCVELVEMIREQVFNFFGGLPPEDVSLLVSPPPPTSPFPLFPPSSPSSPGASCSSPNPLSPRDPRFNLDAASIPPPPKSGEPWEKFAFWPPWSNAISGVHYLSKMLVLVGAGASEMASLPPIARADGYVMERLRNVVAVSRERCVTALCAAWNRDAENIKFVEDWQRSQNMLDMTRMPNSFAAFEGALLAGMQKILYISEAMCKHGAENIVLPPQSKLLQMVRSQYVTTLYKALSGMVENAERSVRKADDDWTTDMKDSVASATSAGDTGRSILNASDRNVRMLLTLGNLQALRVTVVPALNSQFENAFSVKLTDEAKTIKDVLNQIDAKLFQSYTRPSVEKLRKAVQAGISDADWAPPAGAKPTSAKPYVYECLLQLVLVHSQVSTTAPTLTAQVLSYLLEQLTQELLEAFRQRPKYPLEALMQATLDVEFVAQTLTLFTSDRAGEAQSAIYAELDARTDNDARARLQGELPEMRNLLKKLREASRNEFACFKKPRRQATDSK